jgi:glycosyltransferase involved in cell wall biosynthesis
MLRSWGYRSRLCFVGQVPEQGQKLRQLAKSVGLTEEVVFMGDYVDGATYTDFLVAADLGIQLRTHGLGGLSGALLDCISAGLPTVANGALAEAMEAPAYVRRVPDQLSPVLIAEALVELIEKRECDRSRHEEERLAYSAEHSFARYARLLVKGLDLETVST